MGEGTIQTPVPLDKCQACNEQDVIEIAGKKFCANCGTPQPGAATTPASTTPSTPTPSTTPTPSLSHDITTPTAATPVADTASAQDSGETAPIVLPPQPADKMPDPMGTADPTPVATTPPVADSTSDGSSSTVNSEPVDSETSIKVKPKADELHSALQATPSPGIQKYGSASPVGNSAVDTIDVASERAGSEIKSLTDNNDETVMSDAALEELAKAPDEPIVPESIEPKSESSTNVATDQADTEDEIAGLPTPQSSYRLDLTKSQNNNNALPKAVSDVRLAPTSAPKVAPVAASVPASAPTSPIIPLQAKPVEPVQDKPVSTTPTTAPELPSVTVADPAVSGLGAFNAGGTTAATTPASTPPIGSSAPVSEAPPLTPTTTPVAARTTSGVLPSSTPGATVEPVSSGTFNMANVMEANAPVDKAAKSESGGVKLGSVALSLVGLFLVGAYVWQVNYPNLALKVAASKAGISANFPGYVPNGWRLSGNIISTPGNISYNISDSKSSKNLAVKESKTDWDSQALAENYVAPKANNYLALQSQGLTIYIYDGNQASWVNNGTWYRIEGKDHGLSQDQIIKLATSL